MNAQALHIILLVLVVVIFFQQANKKHPYQATSESYSEVRTVAEEAAAAAAEAASVADTESRLEQVTTIDDAMKAAEMAATGEISTSNSETVKPFEKKEFKNRETIRITNPSTAASTLNCDDQDVELIAPSLNISLSGRCGRVRVGGPNSVVNISNAELLDVGGPESVVKIDRVDHIVVSGPDAKVYYASGLTKNQPTIEQYAPVAVIEKR